jgi:hypothetical protein
LAQPESVDFSLARWRRRQRDICEHGRVQARECAAVDAEFIRVVEFLRANANQAAGVAARSVVLRPDLQANSINELPLLRRWLF